MSENKIVIKRKLHASIEKVWDALTIPSNLAQWHSPEGMTCPEVTGDLRVGGRYRIVMEGKNMPNPDHNGIMAVGGEYLEIERPTRLVFTWLWEGAPEKTHTTHIEINLKEIDGTTDLELIQSGFPDDHMKHEHDMGWNSTFNKLDVFLK